MNKLLESINSTFQEIKNLEKEISETFPKNVDHKDKSVVLFFGQKAKKLEELVFSFLNKMEVYLDLDEYDVSNISQEIKEYYYQALEIKKQIKNLSKEDLEELQKQLNINKNE